MRGAETEPDACAESARSWLRRLPKRVPRNRQDNSSFPSPFSVGCRPVREALRAARGVMAEDAKGAFPGDGADAATARAPEPETSRPVFVAPAMVAQTGASMVKGGRRLSGRVCLTWKGTGTCAFGDACRFLHPTPPSRVSPDNSIVPPLGYVTHKAQQQLGADPSRSLLAEILESSGLFRRVADASLCAVLWAQSFTTGALYDGLPDGAFVNHFPNSVAITHKHRLVLSLRSTPGGEAAAPAGFLLPAEAEGVRASRRRGGRRRRRRRRRRDETKTVSLKKNSKSANESSRRETGKRPIRWIVKRSVGGEGRGIAVCADAEAVLKRVRGDAKSRVAPTSLPVERRKANDETPKRDADGRKAPSVGVDVGASHVVQRYVPRPLRVFGRKVDLRVYVLVTGWGTADADARGERLERTSEGPLNAPLGVRAYAYAEGLVRFAAAPYDAFDADEARHLTNNALATAREHQSAASGFRVIRVTRFRNRFRNRARAQTRRRTSNATGRSKPSARFWTNLEVPGRLPACGRASAPPRASPSRRRVRRCCGAWRRCRGTRAAVTSSSSGWTSWWTRTSACGFWR